MHLFNSIQPQTRYYSSIIIFLVVSISPYSADSDTILKFSEKDFIKYRGRVINMFNHAYEGYLKHAYPYDELQPLTCNGHDTWGSYSLTLIDALDTLIIMGNNSEFRRIAQVLIDNSADLFDLDINASVFETNIRVVGGLLSAHLFQLRAGMVLEPGWPCSGPLLRMAENIARKLLPAFDTPTGMPYGTVNLRHGVPRGETTVTCTAGVGTFIIEFGSLSRLTGDPVFEKVAMRALRALWDARSELGLVGNHVDVSDGKWTALDSGVGGGIDSYFEYLVKGSIMFQIPELLQMYREYEKIIEKHLKRDDWYMWAHMKKGGITLPLFTSLDCYLPGIQCLLGDIDKAMKTIHNFHQVWKQYGFTPEYYNIPKSEVHHNREGYPLRPELIESVVYLYQATKDPYLLEIGIDILESIEHSAKTSCGYATIKDVRDHRLEDRMESFFLAETAKYLYLLFDKDNFLHNAGGRGTIINTPSGECIIDTGGYIFNTEAHPLDLAAVHCCSAKKKEEGHILQTFHDNLNLLELLDITPLKQAARLGHRLKTKKQPRTESHGDGRPLDVAVGEAQTDSQSDNKDQVDGQTIDVSVKDTQTDSQSDSKDQEVDKSADPNIIVTKGDSSDHEGTQGVPESGTQGVPGEEKAVNVLPNVPNASIKPVTVMKETLVKTPNLNENPAKIIIRHDKTHSQRRTLIKLEEKTTPVGGSTRGRLGLASQLMDMLASLTSSSADTNTTQHPSTYHLYQVMRQYSLNYSTLPELFHCPAQPFHMRMSVLGEMFEYPLNI
ncbi:ER degradation-enhancing alpha-mannosidase-like protein 2 [Gigantopelta aegis]|uniref:ER degradation-enhancing alpha-mannosidase-like protein 2 n=1 Tax=Gigantopelta aegis TaxID=1735272 RepID=UPI001B889010|nr:ER degradation-enhancing alpha-mannosidase-like protein 2 [Gigantopelta aegis]